MLPPLKGVNFETDSAKLRASAYPLLDKVVAVLKRHPQVRLRVIGHTDSRGTDKYNLYLSWRRAHSVMDYLVKHGIAPERLESIGHGEQQPIASNKTPEGRAKNRRVEFRVIHARWR
jgi:OOP family OmpA-OmpF porin